MGERATPATRLWLEPEEMRAWRALMAVQGRLMARLDEDLVAGHGLPLADYEVLVHLSEEPSGALRMSQLAELTAVSRSGLTRRVDGLVAQGLVCRRPCPHDRRGTMAALTASGAQRLAQAAPTHVAGVRRYLIDLLTSDQLRSLGEALEQVLEPDRAGL